MSLLLFGECYVVCIVSVRVVVVPVVIWRMFRCLCLECSSCYVVNVRHCIYHESSDCCMVNVALLISWMFRSLHRKSPDAYIVSALVLILEGFQSLHHVW